MDSAASIGAPRISEAALARLLGVSRQSINEHVKRGTIDKGADGLIDVHLAKLAIANRVRPSGKTAEAVAPTVPVPTPPSAPADTSPAVDMAATSYHVAKTLREAAEARMAELKLAEMRRQLIRADDVRALHAKAAVQFREALMQIAARLAPILAAETDQSKIQTILDAEHRHALTEFTRAPDAAEAVH